MQNILFIIICYLLNNDYNLFTYGRKCAVVTVQKNLNDPKIGLIFFIIFFISFDSVVKCDLDMFLWHSPFHLCLFSGFARF